MAKKKNLTREDLEDVSIYEDQIVLTNGNSKNGIKLQDVQIQVKCLNKKQKDLKQAIEEKDVVISTGAAGTGKTYLSLLAALHIMKTQPQYRKLILIKSLQVIKGETLGILPGNVDEKIYPYMQSFISNLDKIFKINTITASFIERGIIELYPIAYIRGITWDNSIVICDETQNINMHTFKTVITRMGKNTKMIFLGDIDQCDLSDKEKNSSCLEKVFNLFENEDFVGTINFKAQDCIRNPLIEKILNIIN